MDVYILDSLLRRSELIDAYESFIWTERWVEEGDFELLIRSNHRARSLFLEDTLLATNNSLRVMQVKKVEDSTDADGQRILKITGLSLESILKDRMAKLSLSVDPKWIITGTPGEVARHLFDHVCRSLTLSPYDAIPFLTPGSIFTPGTIPEPTETIEWEQEPGPLYDALKAVCEAYDLGFRLVRNGDASELYFDVYSGSDRTTKQVELSPVVFSVGLDNIQNTTEFRSVTKAKNVAYVFSEHGTAVVYADGVDPDVSGFARKVLYVAGEVDEAHPNKVAVLEQQGREALSKHRSESIFDGEVDQRTTYQYGIDYNLGDLVELRNQDGVSTYKRVTEQIFVSDSNGERAYPTLSHEETDGLKTWLNYGNDSIAWSDYDTEVWADM